MRIYILCIQDLFLDAKYQHSVLSLAHVNFKFYVSPASKLSPGEGEPSEEAGTPFPGQESAEDIEEEESGTQKDSQKVLDKSQGTQQSEGNNITEVEALW